VASQGGEALGRNVSRQLSIDIGDFKDSNGFARSILNIPMTDLRKGRGEIDLKFWIGRHESSGCLPDDLVDIRLEPRSGHRNIFVVKLDADIASAELAGDQSDCAGAEEGVKHIVTGVRGALMQGQLASAERSRNAPRNRVRGYGGGTENSVTYNVENFAGRLNVFVAREEDIGVASGEYNFPADEVAYIDRHYIVLDHTPRRFGRRCISMAGLPVRLR
jgi:hypothetical protein